MIERLAICLQRRISCMSDMDYELGLIVAGILVAALLVFLGQFLKP